MTTEPGAIEPDTKNWTWVLERACPECGFDATSVAPEAVGPLVRANASAWIELLAGPEPSLRGRSRPDRWSPLEYACHVRDVFVLFDTRLRLMLEEDDPLFENWDQDATALESRYDLAEPATVSVELAAAADQLATAFESVRVEQQGRTGRRTDGATFTVATFGRYLIHDPIHHVWDVRSELAAPAS
jgi:hypothetical protein